MYIVCVVTLGFLFDCILGDPEGVWHPVRAIGGLIAFLERLLRRVFPKNPQGEFAAGVVLWFVVCGTSFGVTFFLLRWVRDTEPLLGFAAETLMCAQILARKSLADAGKAVQDALANSLEAGRVEVAKYVGRDTGCLSAEGVAKAAVETVAENLNDGVIAPLLFMLIGGAPLGFFYKAANTLDSMVGYHNEQYEYLGKFSARADDALGFISARLSAACLIAVTGMLRMDNRNALRVFRRDRKLTRSPNAGQTEAACAGALHIQLGGEASYFGMTVEKPLLGDPGREVTKADIGRACDLMTLASVLALVLCGTVRLVLGVRL